jgi:hypothetical protein
LSLDGEESYASEEFESDEEQMSMATERIHQIMHATARANQAPTKPVARTPAHAPAGRSVASTPSAAPRALASSSASSSSIRSPLPSVASLVGAAPSSPRPVGSRPVSARTIVARATSSKPIPARGTTVVQQSTLSLSTAFRSGVTTATSRTAAAADPHPLEQPASSAFITRPKPTSRSNF